MALRNVVTFRSYNGKINEDLRIVLQMSSRSTFVDAVCFTGPKKNEIILPVDLSVFVNTVLFKSASQPGLARVLLILFDFEGIAMRRIKACDLRGGPYNKPGYCVGKSFLEIKRDYDQAVLVGVIRPSMPSHKILRAEGLGLCPAPETLIEKNDLIVFIGPVASPNISYNYFNFRRQQEAYISQAAEKFEKFNIDRHIISDKSKKNTLVCGWRNIWDKDERRFKRRIMEIAMRRLSGSVIIFLNHVDLDEFALLMEICNIHPCSSLFSKLPKNYSHLSKTLTEDSTPNRLYEMDKKEAPGVYVWHIFGDAAVTHIFLFIRSYICIYFNFIFVSAEISIVARYFGASGDEFSYPHCSCARH